MFNWSNLFKIIWWFLLLLGIGTTIGIRFCSIISGKTNNIDIILILVFIALAILPLVSEVSLFGVKLKQQIKEIKENVEKLNLNIGQNVVNHIGYPPPSPAEYSEINSKLDKLISEHKISDKSNDLHDMFNDNAIAFKTRLAIEQELSRIIRNRDIQLSPMKAYSPRSMLNALIGLDIVDPKIILSTKGVLAVCNRGVHGIEFSQDNLNFIKEAGPKIISYLKSI